jgi:REP element-mobilizing transposase RayT
MPHSYTSIVVHVVFSTKDRRPQLDAALEERLYPYLGGILRELGGKLIAVNGFEDHLHLLAAMKGTTSIAETVGKIKGSSSKWIHETFPDRRRFAWQRGYAAFSVSESQRARVVAYIDRQKIHHAKFSFRDEFLRLLQGHGISPDEKYLWT